jgi:hypothetical protein
VIAQRTGWTPAEHLIKEGALSDGYGAKFCQVELENTIHFESSSEYIFLVEEKKSLQV